MLDPACEHGKCIVTQHCDLIVILAERTAEPLQDLLLHLGVVAPQKARTGIVLTAEGKHRKTDLLALRAFLLRCLEGLGKLLPVRKIRSRVRVRHPASALVFLLKCIVTFRERALRLGIFLSEGLRLGKTRLGVVQLAL